MEPSAPASESPKLLYIHLSSEQCWDKRGHHIPPTAFHSCRSMKKIETNKLDQCCADLQFWQNNNVSGDRNSFSASLPSSAAVSTYPRLFSCSLRLLDVPPDWPQVLPTVLLRGRTLPFWKTVVEPTQTKQAARFQLSWECRHSSDTILGGVWCKVRGPQLFSQRLFCCRSGSPQ